MQTGFITQRPQNHFLSTLVDYYFFIDTPVDALSERQEYVIPFPRITFGFFFDHPFMVTNHDLRVSKKVDMVISRISTQRITVLPLTNRIKIIGAHVRPHALAHLTPQPINQLPWLIDTAHLFGKTATLFRQNILKCNGAVEMFEQIEKVFLNTVISRNLEMITRAVELIESNEGNVKLSELADRLQLSDRALRQQFQKCIGCAPKDYIQLVQLKKSVRQMHFTDDSLTNVSYQNNYFDQAHFINSFKKITGRAPKNLRKEMPNFRFLQF